MTLVFPTQHTKKKQTPQGIEPCPDKVRSATTGVFCFFVVAVIKKRAKAKPGGTKVCSSRKRKPLNTWLLYYPVTTWGFRLVTRLKLEERDNGFPIPQHFPTTLYWQM